MLGAITPWYMLVGHAGGLAPSEIHEDHPAMEYAEQLRMHAHELGTHGLSAEEFYNSGLFRGAIERIRGQFSATMTAERAFAQTMLEYMKTQGTITKWVSTESHDRHDYLVHLPDGRQAAIEMKGCLDGNNTTIFERPANADELIIWSLCQNAAADPRHNVWSGIHVRLSAEMVSRNKHVDGLVVWDEICGTIGRRCPKIAIGEGLAVGPYQVPPPCIYLFPRTVPHPRSNPSPRPHTLAEVGFLDALYRTFGGAPEDITSVSIGVAYEGTDIVRTTKLVRNNVVIAASSQSSINR